MSITTPASTFIRGRILVNVSARFRAIDKALQASRSSDSATSINDDGRLRIPKLLLKTDNHLAFGSLE